MDFFMGLQRMPSGKNHARVIVDHLTKNVHFFQITNKNTFGKLTRLDVKEIVRLHGIPKAIILD